MTKKAMLLVASLVLLPPSHTESAGWGELLKVIATEAAKAMAGEAGKSTVEYFKKLFNKDPTIAKEKGAPQLHDEGIQGKGRKWNISPAGTLTKDEILDLARTLKALDQGREQTISTIINSRSEEIANTEVDNEAGILINKAEGPVTVTTSRGTQGNETTVGDIRSNTNTQININSPNPVQNLNQKRVFQRQGRIERAMDGDIHVLKVILTQTQGIWDAGEQFQVDMHLSGPFIDYRFLSGLPIAQSDQRESSEPAKGTLYYSTRTAPNNEPVVIAIRSHEALSITQMAVGPLGEE